jgi:hypothetical protein
MTQFNVGDIVTKKLGKKPAEIVSKGWYSKESWTCRYLHSKQTWYYRDVDRHDPALVQVVEELGKKAGGNYAELAIAEVYGPYRIDEYDGYESVETADSYDWITP